MITHLLEADDAHPALDRLITEVRSFNATTSGVPRGRPFAIELRDAAGALIGGVGGHVWGYSLHIGVLWVHADARRGGHGRELLTAAEAHGRSHGARLAHVETLSFQARPFYEKQGYHVFGQLEEIAPDTTYYFLTKSLR